MGRGRMREQEKDLNGSRDTSRTPLTPRRCVNLSLPASRPACPGPLSAMRLSEGRSARGFRRPDGTTAGIQFTHRRSPTCDDDATNSTNPKSEPTLKPTPVPTPGPSGPLLNSEQPDA